MPTFVYILLGIVAFLALSGLGVMFAYTYPISKRVYQEQLVRTSPEKWGRTCSFPDNQEQLAMWDEGCAWAKENKAFAKEVTITNEGLHLYGEYYDFGSNRCVIILPGRCESLMYSYYFAPPYQQAGFNVLVIDSRCHGKSDGIHNTIGVKEAGDVIAWSNFACQELGNKEIWYHGICIGTASALFAMTAENCPGQVRGFVTEGCFVSFRETFKQHMIVDKRPLFPVLDLVMLHIRKHAKTNVYLQKPIGVIGKLNPNIRALFLYGKKDVFSLPEKSQRLFNRCSCKDKKLVWFENGGHSHLRINNTNEYDAAIIEFTKE